MQTPVSSLIVAGRRIPAAGVRDVADAIHAAGVTVPDGRLLSVLTHRVLDAHASPARILVDGAAAALATPVHVGEVVTFIPGADRIEATRTVQVPVDLDAAAAALYTSHRRGLATAVEGVVSGEQVSSAMARAPAVGHLRAPARLALTFDDGPNRSFTAEVMTLLAAHHVPAVFCLIGKNALSAPDLARRETTAGYRLCDHTQNHPLNLPDLPATRIAAEMRDGYRSIVRADGGISPVYFRAPGGNWSSAIVADARTDHLIPLRWTVDPRDWSQPGTEEIITRVLDQLRPGGVVLLHDGGGDRSQTVAALARLLDELAAAGWSFTFPNWIT